MYEFQKIVKLSILLVIVFAFTNFVQWQTLTGKVIGITDGDTITLLDNSNKQFKIRLLDIDSPEKNQSFGQTAKQHLSNLIYGQTVEVQWQKLDRNQRVLGTVIFNTININKQMVQDGYAWHFIKYSKDDSFSKLEKTARENRLGLWQDATAIAPWLFRKNKKEVDTN